tara:strand:+ start:2170 stop:2358 length:189 start_codon:yes stop_codon:yes gene_type:complete
MSIPSLEDAKLVGISVANIILEKPLIFYLGSIVTVVCISYAHTIFDAIQATVAVAADTQMVI